MIRHMVSLCLTGMMVPGFLYAAPQPLKTLVFGDSGTGQPDQYKVAEAMRMVCDSFGCDQAVMLGDNIYNNGAGSSDDIQFIEKFEEPYKELNFPFYVALGNHDVRMGKRGTQAQVDYTSRSEKWKMYAPYYAYERGSAAFFVIDSNTINTDEQQQAWLRAELRSSTHRWKVVYGHHSPYSVGRHVKYDWLEGGKLKKMKSNLHDDLCQYADAYFAGHDHHLQMSLEECGLLTVVSGAAAKTRKIYDDLVDKKNEVGQVLFADGDQLGFIHATFNDLEIELRVYNDDAELLYEKGHSKHIF